MMVRLFVAIFGIVVFNLLFGLLLDNLQLANVYGGPAHFALAMMAMFGFEIFVGVPLFLLCRLLWHAGSRAAKAKQL